MSEEQHYIILRKEDPIAWALLPYAIERIKRFCVKYETDGSPDELAKLIRHHFVVDDPLILVAVGYEQGRGVFAHTLACLDEILGKRILTIMQVESDIKLDREAAKLIFAEFKVWGLKHNADEVRLVTPDESRANHFETVYGFKKHRIVMRKSLLES